MAPKKKPVKVADGKDEPIISDSKPLTTTEELKKDQLQG
jgi:hypothetical protein